MIKQLSTNQLSSKKPARIYDLEERTARFAEKVIDLLKKLPKNNINNPLIEQLTASAGSIGANYCEATEAESKKDFQHKMGISKKETKESKYWLRILARANFEFDNEFRELWKEAHELLLIFSQSIKSSKNIS